jgi:hypothetical protein
MRAVVETVCENLDEFIRFSSEAMPLWDGCDRVKLKGKPQKYHKFPDEIRRRAKDVGVTLDSRPNGPAIAAFLLAGGRRPKRIGSSNAWSVHHLYAGKYPYVTTHAAKLGRHFTRSAGHTGLKLRRLDLSPITFRLFLSCSFSHSLEHWGTRCHIMRVLNRL